MEKIKIKNIKTGAIEEVVAELVDDFVGTGEWELFVEQKEIPKATSFIKKSIKD